MSFSAGVTRQTGGGKMTQNTLHLQKSAKYVRFGSFVHVCYFVVKAATKMHYLAILTCETDPDTSVRASIT